MYEHLTILWMGIVKAILYMAKYPDTCYLNLWGDYKCGINHTFPGEANDKDNDMVKFLRQHPQITHLRVNKKYNESTILPCVLDMVIKVIRANIPSLTHMNLRYVKLTISELSLIVEALKENNSIFGIYSLLILILFKIGEISNFEFCKFFLFLKIVE